MARGLTTIAVGRQAGVARRRSAIRAPHAEPDADEAGEGAALAAPPSRLPLGEAGSRRRRARRRACPLVQGGVLAPPPPPRSRRMARRAPHRHLAGRRRRDARRPPPLTARAW